MGFLSGVFKSGHKMLGNSIDRQIRRQLMNLATAYFANAPVQVVYTIYGFFGRDTPEEETRIRNLFYTAQKETKGSRNDRLARQVAIDYINRFAEHAPFVAVLPIYDILNRIVNDRLQANDDIIRELHERAMFDIEHSNEGRYQYARDLLMCA